MSITISIKTINYELFEYLMSKYQLQNKYELKNICHCRRNEADRHYIGRRDCGGMEVALQYKEFVTKIQSYCLESICYTKEDKKMLNECIIDVNKRTKTFTRPKLVKWNTVKRYLNQSHSHNNIAFCLYAF